MAHSATALHANFDVDYVITYSIHNTCRQLCSPQLLRLIGQSAAKAVASANFQNLVQDLARVGLAIEVRNGENCSLLVFVKVATDERLNIASYRFR